MAKKRLKGVVVSDKMQKTVVVKVERIKAHPKYKKRYKISKRYKAHDEKQVFKTGDRVVIEECRPISRHKKWRVVKKQEVGSKKQETEAKEQEQADETEKTA
jgi:small subunit ribosomal protein S17